MHRKIEFNDDIIIVDPFNLIDSNEWSYIIHLTNSDNSYSLAHQVVSYFDGCCICDDTISYKDWIGDIYHDDTDQVIGNVKSYSGLLCIVQMKDILKYNHSLDIQKMIEKKEATVIDDFDGYVIMDCRREAFNIEGIGNHPFYIQDHAV